MYQLFLRSSVLPSSLVAHSKRQFLKKFIIFGEVVLTENLWNFRAFTIVLFHCFIPLLYSIVLSHHFIPFFYSVIYSILFHFLFHFFIPLFYSVVLFHSFIPFFYSVIVSHWKKHQWTMTSKLLFDSFVFFGFFSWPKGIWETFLNY